MICNRGSTVAESGLHPSSNIIIHSCNYDIHLLLCSLFEVRDTLSVKLQLGYELDHDVMKLEI